MRGIRFVRGWVRFSVSGDFAERFYNLLIQQGLQPYDMCRTEDGCMELNLPRRQFSKIRTARRMTGVHITVIDKGGLPKTVWKYRKRWGLVIGAALAAAFVFLMSGFVWSIRFEGDVQDPNALLTALKEEGLFEGCWRGGVDADEVESRILSRNMGLSFISVVFKGSVAQVQIVYEKPKPEMQSTQPCHLIAECDGVITYMMVKEGVPAVQAGDAVQAGELLVSGIFDSETAGIRKVHASGHIYARTAQTLRIEMPYQTVECRRTGRIRRKFTLKIFNFSIKLYFGGGIPYAIYDKIETVTDAHIGEFILPLSVITHTYYEKEEITVTVSAEQAQAAAEQMLDMREWQELFGCEYVCIQRNVTHSDGAAVAEGEYVRVRDIALSVPIE